VKTFTCQTATINNSIWQLHITTAATMSIKQAPSAAEEEKFVVFFVGD